MRRSGSLTAFLSVLLAAGCARPEPAARPLLELLGEWGVEGEGPGQLHQPELLATDPAGLVYIADTGSAFLHKFDALGQPLLSFQDAVFEHPGGLTAGPAGVIYAADARRNRVLVFYPDGQFYTVWRGGPNRRFREPAGMALDADGHLYISEAGAHRIQKFDSNGRFVLSWGREGEAPGEFRAPGAIAAAPDGHIYAADIGNRRVQKFTATGEFVAEWSWASRGASEIGEITALAASEKFLFLADAAGQRVEVWTLDGRRVHTEDFRSGLSADAADAPRPAALAVGARGELLVLDVARRRVLRFRTRR